MDHHQQHCHLFAMTKVMTIVIRCEYLNEMHPCRLVSNTFSSSPNRSQHHFTSSMKHTQSIVYVAPTQNFRFLDRQTRHGIRSSLLHSLISSANLLTHCTVYKLRPATLEQALLAHTSFYLAALHAASSSSSCYKTTPDDDDIQHHDLEPVQITDDILDQSGLLDDCAPFPGVWQLAMLTVGGAVIATSAIIERFTTIACWFDGGRHHAAADSAHGFCYLNDIVVACKLLLSLPRFSKVLYVDIDVHHGDGVEQAFLYNADVTTLSFHLCEPGFFPNSRPTVFPTQNHVKTEALRVPLRRGITDQVYIRMFTQVIDIVFRTKRPDVIVLQCGVDGLAGDPLGGFNLTNAAYIKAVEHVLKQQVPVVILGGGGYEPVNAARVWADVLESCIDWVARERGETYVRGARDVSMTDEFFDKYAPTFRRGVPPLQMRDENNPDELRDIVERISQALGDSKCTS